MKINGRDNEDTVSKENFKRMKETYKKYKNNGHYDYKIDKKLFNKDIQKILNDYN